MATKKAASKAPRARPDDGLALPPPVTNAVAEFYRAAVYTRAPGRRSLALAAIADALEHIVEHDDAEGLKALEQLAKKARRYVRAHQCHAELGETGQGPIAAPTRAELIQGLVDVVEKCIKKPQLSLERLLVARLLHGAAAITLGTKMPSDFAAKVSAEVRSEAKRQRLNAGLEPDAEPPRFRPDPEGFVVAALVGWGLTRAKAREVVKSAMKRSG